MKITWYGHSCFKIETSYGSVVFDPYEDGRVPGYAPLPRDLSADAVFCSHQHRDHNAVNLVSIGTKSPNFEITKLQTYHDEVKGAKRGETTINIITSNGMRVAHMGDIGCELTSEQHAALKGVDVLLIPVGGHFTIDAVQAKGIADSISARVVIPMHYRTEQFGYAEIDTLESFIKLCSDVVIYETNNIEITSETPKQTAVLKYCPK